MRAIRQTFDETGLNNLSGIRDYGMFDLALNKPRMTVDLEDAYVTLEEKAAALVVAVIRNHPFIDGNKRTGILAGLVMLQANGRGPVASPEEAYEVAKRVESGAMSHADLTHWMADWTNVLPVSEEEWITYAEQFDSLPFEEE